MKRNISIYQAIILLIILFLPIVTNASNEPRLYLTPKNSIIKPGESITMNVQIKGISPVYGTEIALAFDQDKLEVIDPDNKTEGTQIIPGSFFNLKQKHFPLQNYADNKEGKIRYAVSLLNPALPAKGDGTLAQIQFKAKADGPAFIRVDKAIFGNRSGESITPLIQAGSKIKISSHNNISRYLLISTITLIILLAIVMGIKKRKKWASFISLQK